jgi:hypothetical protein
VFYPLAYLGQLVRKVPIAVVDDGRTDLSRRFIQTLDADKAISVAVRAPPLVVAQIALGSLSPIDLLMEPLYNPTGGYASYVAFRAANLRSGGQREWVRPAESDTLTTSCLSK